MRQRFYRGRMVALHWRAAVEREARRREGVEPVVLTFRERDTVEVGQWLIDWVNRNLAEMRWVDPGVLPDGWEAEPEEDEIHI